MTQRPSIKVFDEWRIRKAISDSAALSSAERAFRSLGKGLATVPPPLGWEFPNVNGEVHIKGAHLHDSSMFTFKVASGFYGNVELGVPTGSGFVLIFDAETGFPRGILADNGYLTDLRTAAAGALAASLLAPKRPLHVAVLGAGVQGQLQLRLISQVCEIAKLSVWSRSPSRTTRWTEILAEAGRPDAVGHEAPEEAVADADLVITATPARAPLIRKGALKQGATLIAVGSDGPYKQEVEAEVVAGADKVVTDLTSQCAKLGEVHHAVRAGLMTEDDVHAELGEIVLEEKPGREGDETILCDLTGVGAQDAAIGELVFVELAGQDARMGAT
jgi:ornithine cyclodeaminase/alanine dehydrogenase-like protein (mu-crystallin family)